MNTFFEKTLEDIVFDNISTIHEKGLDIFYRNSKRQFYLPSGKKIDILTWQIVDDKFFARIIELKREAVSELAYWQILEYYVELLDIIFGKYKEHDIELVLIGSGVLQNVVCASNISDILRLYSYHYDYNGIQFSECNQNISVIKEFFAENNTKSDRYDDFLKILNA